MKIALLLTFALLAGCTTQQATTQSCWGIDCKYKKPGQVAGNRKPITAEDIQANQAWEAQNAARKEKSDREAAIRDQEMAELQEWYRTHPQEAAAWEQDLLRKQQAYKRSLNAFGCPGNMERIPSNGSTACGYRSW